MSETRDALTDLLKHPGWHAFRDYALREWGPHGVRFHAEMQQALNLSDPQAALSQARQIHAAQRLVDVLLEWPAQEIGRLERVELPPPATANRGGYR